MTSLSPTPMGIYLGLGSNIGNALGSPRWHMAQAVSQLFELGRVRASSLYKSVPLGPQDQPDYFNAVVELTLHATMTPHALLTEVQRIEAHAQRERVRHWGERSLDVDILLFDHVTMHTPKLTIPHPGVLVRNFVAVPLYELSSQLVIDNQALADLDICRDMQGLARVESPSWVDTSV